MQFPRLLAERVRSEAKAARRIRMPDHRRSVETVMGELGELAERLDAIAAAIVDPAASASEPETKEPVAQTRSASPRKAADRITGRDGRILHVAFAASQDGSNGS